MTKAKRAKKPVKKSKYDEVFEFPELQGKNFDEIVDTVLHIGRPVPKKKESAKKSTKTTE